MRFGRRGLTGILAFLAAGLLTMPAAGADGLVVSEQFIITLRATTAVTQENATYSTNLVFVVVPEF